MDTYKVSGWIFHRYMWLRFGYHYMQDVSQEHRKQYFEFIEGKEKDEIKTTLKDFIDKNLDE